VIARLVATAAVLIAVAAGVIGIDTLAIGARSHPNHRSPIIYGLTVDDISSRSSIIAMERSLPYKPTTRVVFDPGEPPSYYLGAVRELRAVGPVMGELLDSSYEKSVSTPAFARLVSAYLTALKSDVSFWEIGNEVNGNWTGPYATVSSKLATAYRLVSAAHRISALTLYANEYAPNHCGDGQGELTPVEFTERYVPPSVRDGVRYVFESYYPTECANSLPSAASVTAEMEQLHTLYPHAELGFGEIGLPNAATTSSDADAQRIMSWAYGLQVRLPYYVGGYFWWYGAEDLVPVTKPLFGSFVAALRAEHNALSARGAVFR
jgi:hypothetical protein